MPNPTKTEGILIRKRDLHWPIATECKRKRNS